MLSLISAAASQRDIPIHPEDIEKVEVTGSTVAVYFLRSSQSEALASDRELSLGLSFPFAAAKDMSIANISWVAGRFASISFRLPTPEDGEQFAQGVRDGRVQLSTHPKT